MPQQIAAINYDNASQTMTFDRLPDECPYCHRSITPRIIGNGFVRGEWEAHVVVLCPRLECQMLFIAYYSRTPQTAAYSLNGMSKGNKKAVEISQPIREISPAFATIFEQANIAEQEGLFEICGVGYRKALEFLVKDYSIKRHTQSTDGITDPSEVERIEKHNAETKASIEKKLLGQCIKEYIDDPRIKIAATRATWLGNDETHYVRKWEGKDLNDLKSLIRATTLWMELVAETGRNEKEMA